MSHPSSNEEFGVKHLVKVADEICENIHKTYCLVLDIGGRLFDDPDPKIEKDPTGGEKALPTGILPMLYEQLNISRQYTTEINGRLIRIEQRLRLEEEIPTPIDEEMMPRR